MALTVDQVVSESKLLAAAWSRLPQRMRLLVVAGSADKISWVRRAFESDAACDVQIVEALGMTAAVESLRDQLFDGILIADHSRQLDAFEMTAGLRAAGAEEPVVIVGPAGADQMLALALEAGADAYLDSRDTTVRALIWTLARGIERHTLTRENRRLQQAERRRAEQEQRETQHLLVEQRAIVEELETIRNDSATTSLNEAEAAPEGALSPALFDSYRQLLRSYVIMGAGNLSAEIERFAALLGRSRMSAHETLQMHLRALEALVEGLHSRSTRHVMTRADLLILEVMVHLAEWYRKQYDHEQGDPAPR